MKRALAAIALMVSALMFVTATAPSHSVADGLPHCCV